MARKIVSDEAIADGMIARLTEEKLYEKWIRFAASSEKEEIKNASDYIINCEEDISEWLLSLIPYMEKKLKATPHEDRLRLCTSSACIFSVILHRNSLTYVSMPASFLYNLTKNLTAHLTHNLRAVLP